MRRNKAFTLIELLVVISIIALLIGILLPALGAARKNANMMKNSTQVRSIIQAMLTFANQHKDYLPGRNKDDGEVLASDVLFYGDDSDDPVGHDVQARYAILLEGNIINGDILLSPGDTRSTSWTTGAVRADHYSYALLGIDRGGGRRKVWEGGSISSSSPLISDRLTSTTQPSGSNGDVYKSYWSGTAESWKGAVGFGDAHAAMEDDETLKNTRFTSLICPEDDLFYNETNQDCKNQNNALMIQKGDGSSDGDVLPT